MTGTSNAVRWLAISKEGRVNGTRGAMRGPSTDHNNGRITPSRNAVRTQKIAGHHGQRGKTASSFLRTGKRFGRPSAAGATAIAPKGAPPPGAGAL